MHEDTRSNTKIAQNPTIQVIKIEWPERLDILRGVRHTTPPGIPEGPNTIGQFTDTNANKRGITLNIRSPKGVDIAKQLVAKVDLVIENASAGHDEKSPRARRSSRPL